MKNADQIEFQTVAKRYAQALIELCEKDSVNKEEILANLNMIVETIKESNDLSVVMSAPNISKNAKLSVIPIILMLALFIFVPALNASTVGIMVPVGVIFTVITARILYKKGVL